MNQETSLESVRQNNSVDSGPASGERPRTSSDIMAARVRDWAASHAIRDDALLLNIRSVIEGALSEYFRFLTCDGDLMIVSHSSPGGNAMLLILLADDRNWRVAYKNDADISDVPAGTLDKLLDNARSRRAGEAAALCPGWTHARDDIPLSAFVCSRMPIPFRAKVMEYFCVMSPLPGQRVRRKFQFFGTLPTSATICRESARVLRLSASQHDAIPCCASW